MHPTTCKPLSCSHLKEYRRCHDLQGYSSLQTHFTTSPSGRTAIAKFQSLIPRCSLCSRSLHRSRLYLCLICSSISCTDHAAAHSQANPGHEIAADVNRAELFCCSCADQVYDPDFDRVVMTNQLLEMSKDGENDRSRKRRAAVMDVGRGPRDTVLVVGCGVKSRSCNPLGLRGLNNLGSTCFINAVLQALLHTPPLKNYFLGDWHNRELCRKQRNRRRRRVMETGEFSCLVCDVDSVFSEVFSGNRTPYTPARFLYSWWRHSSNLASYEQQDAHEFFISMLDMIHECERSTLQNKGIFDCHCLAHRMFSGVLRSDVTCTVCGFTSTTYDPYIDLSLDLEPYTDLKYTKNSRISTLMGCLDLFTRPEKLGSDQKLYCQHCQMQQDSVKQLSIRRLPLVLCFHIKRFEHSLRKGTSRKIDQSLQFPFSLDMTPYLSYSIIRNRFGNRIFAFEGDESDMSNDLSSEFEVFAVITHSGGLESGHYVSYIRIDEKWYKCDDSWITQVSEGVVRAAQGYMMYYVQKQIR